MQSRVSQYFTFYLILMCAQVFPIPWCPPSQNIGTCEKNSSHLLQLHLKLDFCPNLHFAKNSNKSTWESKIWKYLWAEFSSATSCASFYCLWLQVLSSASCFLTCSHQQSPGLNWWLLPVLYHFWTSQELQPLSKVSSMSSLLRDSRTSCSDKYQLWHCKKCLPKIWVWIFYVEGRFYSRKFVVGGL